MTLIERLRQYLVMSMFSTTAHLYAEQENQRREAANSIEELEASIAAKDALIAKLREALADAVVHIDSRSRASEYELVLIMCEKDDDTALRKLIAKERKAEWQPIETAPRDGTSILLRGTRGRHADGFWERAAYDGNGCWVWPYIKNEPLFWMPLPEAPKP